MAERHVIFLLGYPSSPTARGIEKPWVISQARPWGQLETSMTSSQAWYYSPILRDYISMDLVKFSSFILSYLTISDFELWGDSPRELTYLMPFFFSQNTCLPHGEPYSIKPNFILDSHFHAVHGYAATHMCITHVLCFSSILPPPHGCIMLLISVMPALDSISRFNTNMYIPYDSI